MNCKDAEQMMLFLCEGHLSLAKRNEVNEHITNCNNCQLLYAYISKQNYHIREEKNTEINPYLINKTLLKANQNNYLNQNHSTTDIYIHNPGRLAYVLVLLIGIIAGSLLGSCFTTTDSTSSTLADTSTDVESETQNIDEADVLGLK